MGQEWPLQARTRAREEREKAGDKAYAQSHWSARTLTGEPAHSHWEKRGIVRTLTGGRAHSHWEKSL